MKAIITAAILAATPAAAQQCGPVDVVRVGIAAGHGQTLDGIGWTAGGAAMEVWTDRARGDFTVLIVSADGVACVMARGAGWTVDRTPPGEKM